MVEEKKVVGHIVDEYGVIQKDIHEGDSIKVTSAEEKDKNIKYYDLIKKKDDFRVYINDNFGTFYFNNYINLLDEIGNDYATAFRFLYFCTFSNYDGYVEFTSMKIRGRNKDVNNKYANATDFAEIFLCSDMMGKNIRDKFLEYNLINIQEDGRITVNKKYCNRGSLQNSEYRRNSTRVFDEGIRNIYSSSNMRDHKKIGIVIPLLEHTNVYLNVICRNIEEHDPKYMDVLSLNDICNIIHYPYTNIGRLKKDVFSIKVNDLPFIANVKKEDLSFYVINPAVFYKGNNLNDIEAIIKLFEIR